MRGPRQTVERARGLWRQPTLPEVLLWDALRGNRLGGLRFRRQHPVWPYVLDFFCSAAKVAVEVDGAAHDLPEQAERDGVRDRWLQSEGVTVLRFAARDILSAPRRAEILETILAACAPSLACGGPPPPLRG